jgi:hypothetical protein
VAVLAAVCTYIENQLYLHAFLTSLDGGDISCNASSDDHDILLLCNMLDMMNVS